MVIIKRLPAILLVAATMLGRPAWCAPSDGPHPAQIDRNGVLILVRSTLIALQQANETGNYTVLRDLGAPGFQEANTAARLGEIFAHLREQKLDFSGVVALDPQLTVLPEIESNGIMHFAGFFPSTPVQINFDLAYAPVAGRWRPIGISVGLGSSSPAAPAPPEPLKPPTTKTPKSHQAHLPKTRPPDGSRAVEDQRVK